MKLLQFFTCFVSDEKVLELIHSKDVRRLLKVVAAKRLDAAALHEMIANPLGLESVLEAYICRYKTFGKDGDLQFILNHGQYPSLDSVYQKWLENATVEWIDNDVLKEMIANSEAYMSVLETYLKRHKTFDTFNKEDHVLFIVNCVQYPELFARYCAELNAKVLWKATFDEFSTYEERLQYAMKIMNGLLYYSEAYPCAKAAAERFFLCENTQQQFRFLEAMAAYCLVEAYPDAKYELRFYQNYLLPEKQRINAKPDAEELEMLFKLQPFTSGYLSYLIDGDYITTKPLPPENEAAIWFRGAKELREVYCAKYGVAVKALLENCDKYGVEASQKEKWLRDFRRHFVWSSFRKSPVSECRIKFYAGYYWKYQVRVSMPHELEEFDAYWRDYRGLGNIIEGLCAAIFLYREDGRIDGLVED